MTRRGQDIGNTLGSRHGYNTCRDLLVILLCWLWLVNGMQRGGGMQPPRPKRRGRWPVVFPRKSGLRERSYDGFSLVGVVGFGSSERGSFAVTGNRGRCGGDDGCRIIRGNGALVWPLPVRPLVDVLQLTRTPRRMPLSQLHQSARLNFPELLGAALRSPALLGQLPYPFLQEALLPFVAHPRANPILPTQRSEVLATQIPAFFP